MIARLDRPPPLRTAIRRQGDNVGTNFTAVNVGRERKTVCVPTTVVPLEGLRFISGDNDCDDISITITCPREGGLGVPRLGHKFIDDSSPSHTDIRTTHS